jgi:tetratricopeptide (TPR) repeat protein
LTVQQIGIWKDSISLWSNVIEKEPERFSTAYLNRGAAFERIGQRERAVQDYDKAIELNAFDFQAYDNRGVALENMGQLGKAIQDFDRAIALKHDDSQMFVARGLVYLKVGQVERGVADLKRACDLGDDFGCKAMQYSVKNGP